VQKARPQPQRSGFFIARIFQNDKKTMGKHISKIERNNIFLAKQESELQIKAAFEKSAKIKKSFVVFIKDAQNINCRNDYRNNPKFQLLVSFLIQNEGKTQKKKLDKWIENLTFLIENLEKKCPKWFDDTDYIRALIEVAKYRGYWIRPIEKWKPKSKSDYEKFKDLISHLFAQYDYPNFLNHIFFHQQDHFFISEFIALVQGGSVKAMATMIPLTQKMKVEFMQSPDGFRVIEAFRYAQAISLGADPLLAHRIAYSSLGRGAKRDELLWESFVRILIAGGMFNHDKIGELIDYVNYESNQNREYSLKGRTLNTLLRNSDNWHIAMSQVQRRAGLTTWKSASFEPFEIVEGKAENEVCFKVIELLSNKELTEEGNKMHHCVGSYSSYCERGRTRIVSLRKYQFGIETERLATIEVDMTSKRIVQAKYRFNKPISSKSLSFLHNWANLNGFTMGKYL
jgi:hypothetical protein